MNVDLLLTLLASFALYANLSIYLFRVIICSKLSISHYLKIIFSSVLLSVSSIVLPFHIPRTVLFIILVIILSIFLKFRTPSSFIYYLCKSCIIFVYYLPLCMFLSLISALLKVFIPSHNSSLCIIIVFLVSIPLSYFLASKFTKSLQLHFLAYKHSSQRIVLLSACIAIFLVVLSGIISSETRIQEVILLVIVIFLYTLYSRMIYHQTAELSAENDSLTRLLHDSSRRSFERAAEIDAASPKAEVSALAELNAVNHSYDPAVEENPSDYIDSTGMPLIDEMLQNYYLYACRRGIDFRVYVHDPLTLLFSDYTSYWKQISDTIGNLVANAITAVEKSHAERPEVFCAFGVVAGKHYEIHIFDSGLDFPAKVLERLGEEGNTTGGSGIGMMSILEASRVAKFSLRIQEGEPCYPYTKKIFVVFDGEGRIEIETWRAAQLHVHNPRITVKQLGGELHV